MVLTDDDLRRLGQRWVRVSGEVVRQLREESPPVTVRIAEDDGHELQLVLTTHHCAGLEDPSQ